MKLIAGFVLAAMPTMADAQIYNTIQGTFANSTYGNYGRGFYPETFRQDVYPVITPYGRMDWGDTPTMRRQREKRIAAFRTKVASALASDNGKLTEESQRYLGRELAKLQYRNR